MKPIADQLPIDQILAELTKDKLLRLTNNGNNEVYIFDNNTSPVLMHEVGRVREITFRHAGGGTGKDIDIDEFDLDTKDPQRQLIVWDPENRLMVGGLSLLFPAKRMHKLRCDKACFLFLFPFFGKISQEVLPAHDGAWPLFCTP
jgi:hypothetical protein